MACKRATAPSTAELTESCSDPLSSGLHAQSIVWGSGGRVLVICAGRYGREEAMSSGIEVVMLDFLDSESLRIRDVLSRNAVQGD